MTAALGVFRQIDVNGNDDITLEEFQAWWEVRGGGPNVEGSKVGRSMGVLLLWIQD